MMRHVGQRPQEFNSAIDTTGDRLYRRLRKRHRELTLANIARVVRRHRRRPHWLKLAAFDDE